MAVDVGRRPLPALGSRLSPITQLYGLGTVFGKTVRDSRVAALAVVAVLGGIIMLGGAAMANTYATPEARRELAMLSTSMPPVLQGLYGNPLNVDTLGGFISWHYGAYLALLVGLWSILALSSTLAGEARRASLEFALATTLSRRRVALEKLAGHITAVVAAAAIVALATWATGAAFAKLPGDAVSADAAVGFAAGLAVKALAAGSVAFALACLVGRGAAAGLAGALMLAGYVLNSYRTIVPAFDSVAGLTWFSWLANHVPLAGRSDWIAVGLTALVAVVLFGVGVEAFARRDVGATSTIRLPRLPTALLGVHGPIGRSAAELLPAGVAWGVGVGLYGFVMAVSSRSLTDEIAKTPALADMVRSIVPGIDMTTPSGYLQLAFIEIGFVLAGLAAATLVAGNAGDETGGRTELLLTTPLTRARWAVAGGVGASLVLAAVTAILGASIGAGVSLAGGDALTPALGTAALALYGAALAGVGLAVAGLARSSLAAPVVVAVAIGTFLVDLLAPALRLPDWVHQLALTSHMGEPMVGRWDAAGIVACLALAVGGVALGAWGMRRRDIGR